MAVAFDQASVQTTNLSQTITRTHPPLGTPTGVAVLVGWVDVANATVSGITYGGVALTQIGSTQASASGFWRTAVFGSTSTPSSGDQTVTVTFSAVLSHGGSLCCVTVTGGDTTALSGSGGAVGTSATAGGTVTGTAAGEVAVDILCDNGVTLSSYGAGQTETINAGPTSGLVFGSYKAVSGTSEAMVENIANGLGEWAWSGASFKAPAGGASTRSLFRVGRMTGLGTGGPFFNNPLGKVVSLLRAFAHG